MIFNTKNITLNDGKQSIFRAPKLEDATELAALIKTACGETDFLLRTYDECNETKEQEELFIKKLNESPVEMMIVCEIDGTIAGNCQLSFNQKYRTAHRASIGISILKQFWGLGIGTAMFREMIDAARERNITHLELNFMEGNDRGRALYEKMGFRINSVMPEALRNKDGKPVNEYHMTLLL